MRCSTCGHQPNQHDGGGECHVTVLTGWNDTIQHFSGHRYCGCTRYTGSFSPPNPDGCPHEVTPESSRCVHCGGIKEQLRDA